VYEELRKILFHINIPDIARFEVLNGKIYEVMESVLSRCLMPTDQMIKNLVEIELGYINTNHPDFVGGTNMLLNMVQSNEEPPKIEPIIEERKSDKVPNKEKDKSAAGKQHHHLKETSQGGLHEKDKAGFFSNWLGIGSKRNVAADDYDNKLETLQISTKMSHIDDGKLDSSIRSQKGVFTPYDNPLYIERNSNNQFERTYLAQPPGAIKIHDKMTKREQIEVEMIKRLITSYFNVVKKNICDTVPKTIISFLVNGSKNICERELVANLYREESYEELLAENSYIAKSREECRNTLTLLKNCANILTEIDSKF